MYIAYIQRGLSDPQNGGVIQMCPHWLQLDLVSYGSIAVKFLVANEGTYA
jgi:hypothetical protein